MLKQQYEQVVLNEQFQIIAEEIKDLSEESKDKINNATSRICNIEIAWGMLCAIEIGKYKGILDKEEALNFIDVLEEMTNPIYLKEMKKDLMFITEGEII